MPILYNYTGSAENVQQDQIYENNLGLTYPFGSAGRPFNTTTTTVDMAKSNIRALLQTETNERVMNPELGIGLKQFCFEQMTEELKVIIADKISEAIARWIPYIRVKRVLLTIVDNNELADYNTMQIKLSFILKDDPTIEEQLEVQIKP